MFKFKVNIEIMLHIFVQAILHMTKLKDHKVLSYSSDKKQQRKEQQRLETVQSPLMMAVSEVIMLTAFGRYIDIYLY